MSEDMHSEIKQRILENRGTHYPESYLPGNLLKPDLLQDGERAAKRIAKGLLFRQRMVVVADYDADGATGAAMFIRGMRMLAKAAGVSADCQYIVPDRFVYGYGLKPELADDKIKPLSPAIVITIDNGISSQAAVKHMKSWPSSPVTIITDHHTPGDTIPDAFAVINPNRTDCEFPSKALCGCGVAFYLLLLVRRAMMEQIESPDKKTAVSKVKLVQLLDLVAIATIGDVVPLDENNRLLVKLGLDRINRGMSLPTRDAHKLGYLSMGVRALLEKAGAKAPITSTDLAFKVVPRLNAIGRLDNPVAGIECLLADTWTIAQLEAEKCDKANNERKSIQKHMANDADKMLADISSLNLGSQTNLSAVVLFDESWHPGIVGLTASKVKEKTGGAVICFSPDIDPKAEPAQKVADSNAGPEILKGSGRSDNVHLRDAIALVASWAPEIQMVFGGHARAAGLSINRDDLDRFKALFEKAVEHLLSISPLENRTWIDGELTPEHRTLEFASWIEGQPWGQMFPAPTFRQAFFVEEIQRMKGPHVKLLVRDARVNHKRLELVWFNSVVDDTPLPFSENDLVALDYRLGVNRWNGRSVLQGTVEKGRLLKAIPKQRVA